MTDRKYRNPVPTVDIIIETTRPDGQKGIVLIKRRNPPYGWALPGGFVDYGESLEEAALREAEEETSLKIKLIRQFHTYSSPHRDPRLHTITTVYLAEATGEPQARDDALEIGVFTREEITFPLAFDHAKILTDYFQTKSFPESKEFKFKEVKMGGGAYHEILEKLSPKTRELHRALQSLIEELEAIDWYQQRVDASEDEELRSILAHNRDEEKEHAAMLLEWLRRNDESLAKELKEYLFTTKKITALEEEK
jgi:ferritin-like protein